MSEAARSQQQGRFRLHDLEIDLDKRTVRRRNQVIPLPDLSFRLLAVLLRHAPDTISKDDLIKEVWDDVVVGDEALAQRVRLLRQALGEDAQGEASMRATVDGVEYSGHGLSTDIVAACAEALLEIINRATRSIAKQNQSNAA